MRCARTLLLLLVLSARPGPAGPGARARARSGVVVRRGAETPRRRAHGSGRRSLPEGPEQGPRPIGVPPLALDEIGRPDEAVEQDDLYLKLEPDDAKIRLNRAVALAHARRLEPAWEETERLVTRLPAEAALFNLRGVILIQQGDPQRALQELTTALTLTGPSVQG